MYFIYTGKDKQFMYNIFLPAILKRQRNNNKKKDPEGCQLLRLLIPRSLINSSPVWCLAIDICLIGVWRGFSVTLQILIQMHRQSYSISKLEKNDGNRFITRLWWSSPEAAWRADIFGSLEKDVLNVFYIFFSNFYLLVVDISWSNNRLIVSCNNWSTDSSERIKKAVNTPESFF